MSGEIVGNTTRAKVIKNKVAPPFREAEFDMMHARGICKFGELLDVGVHLGNVVRAGSWYSFASGINVGGGGEEEEEEEDEEEGEGEGEGEGEREKEDEDGACMVWPAEEAKNFGQGKEKARQYLMDHPERAELLENNIIATIAERRRKLLEKSQEAREKRMTRSAAE